jgi:hypothetical protein
MPPPPVPEGRKENVPPINSISLYQLQQVSVTVKWAIIYVCHRLYKNVSPFYVGFQSRCRRVRFLKKALLITGSVEPQCLNLAFVRRKWSYNHVLKLLNRKNFTILKEPNPHAAPQHGLYI